MVNVNDDELLNNLARDILSDVRPMEHGISVVLVNFVANSVCLSTKFRDNVFEGISIKSLDEETFDNIIESFDRFSSKVREGWVFLNPAEFGYKEIRQRLLRTIDKYRRLIDVRE